MVEFYSPGKKYPGPQAIFMPHPAIPTQTLLERFLTEAPGLKQKVPMAGIFHKDFRHIRSTAAEALQRLTQTPNMPWRLSHAQHLLLGDTAFSFESRERVSQSPKTFSMPLVRFGDNDFLTTCPTDHRMVIRGKSCSHSAVQVLFNGINVSSGRRDQRFDDLRGDVVSDNVMFLKSGRSTDIVGWRDWDKGRGQSRAFLPFMGYDDAGSHVTAVFEVYGHTLTPEGQVFYERDFFESLLADLTFLASQPDNSKLWEWHLGYLLRAYSKPEEVIKTDPLYDHLQNIDLPPQDIRARLQRILSEESSLLHAMRGDLNPLENMLRGGARLYDAYYRLLDPDLRVSRLWNSAGSGAARVYVVSPKTFKAWVGVDPQEVSVTKPVLPHMREPARRASQKASVPKAIQPVYSQAGYAPYSTHGKPLPPPLVSVPIGLPPISAISPTSQPDGDDDLGPYGNILTHVIPPNPYSNPDLDENI